MFLNAIARTTPNWARYTLAALGAAALLAAPAYAQEVETFDPDEAYTPGQTSPASTGGIDADLAAGANTAAPTAAPPLIQEQAAPQSNGETATYPEASEAAAAEGGPTVASADPSSQTFGEDDLIGAAEGVFGKGAEGLAKMIQKLLKDQGEPNGYIVGREAGGAFIVGARYGSGTLFHKIEGQRPVYWTGPSIGLDAGANAANTFVLVYNLFDTEELYERFPAGEGQVYLIGGLHASYMRKGDIVLIPVRMGAGLRLGVNAGYMKFSKKQRWLPF